MSDLPSFFPAPPTEYRVCFRTPVGEPPFDVAIFPFRRGPFQDHLEGAIQRWQPASQAILVRLYQTWQDFPPDSHDMVVQVKGDGLGTVMRPTAQALLPVLEGEG